MSQTIGFAAEKQARDFLTRQGLRWLGSNYRCRWGEIDLVMSEGDLLVFVEVRSRISAEYGNALESITYGKQKKIMKTATHYMTTKKMYNTHSCRFDVVSIQGHDAQIEWVKNAFGMGF
ncbi:YraN family protein [Legionella sp. CNM-4043-24]|uniref:YraN family protein n=1 Tax=Legionella sp. CNM-4043-24 TaxID=3421646 RepID=UPI00403B1272